MAESKRLL